MIDFYCSQPHYWRHLYPVLAVLRARGHQPNVWAPRGINTSWGRPLGPYEDAHVAQVVVVAGEIDARRFQHTRKVIYLEHGAGQTYLDGLDGDVGYSGGPNLDHCLLFLCPSEQVAARWRVAYPKARAIAVGCPALDVHNGPIRKQNVYVTTHWRCSVCPETWPVFDEYRLAIEALREDLDSEGITLVGHSHPRDATRRARDYAEMGISFEPDPDVVLDFARLLIADNTSLMYEAASLDIPVLALNGKQYRRDVEHGMRFWSQVPGMQCDRPVDLSDAVAAALTDPVWARIKRVEVAADVYAVPSTLLSASSQAADAIEGIL